ncbi:MAG: ABC transporter permease [Nanoarchaeota archaeon]|nr:ABC transporter permease [Nanoarchaeota archaeon]MBU1103456.1 ABC transporter permease [Nanoarchaeota archaeon]
MLSDYFYLAFKNVRKRGIRSWLTILGIFIGIAAVVSLVSLGNGLQAAINAQFGISSTEVITVQAGGLTAYGPPGSGVIDPLVVEDVEEIGKLSSVKRAVRRNIRTGKLEYNDITVFGMAIDVPDGEERDFVYEVLDAKVETGRLLKDGDDKKVVLGYNFYVDKVGLSKIVEPGDKVLIDDESFEVVGIFEKKGSFIFDNIVLMNAKPMQDLIGYGDEVDTIAVQVKDKDEMELVKEDIEKLMRKRRDVKKGEEDFEVSTPEGAMEQVNSVLNGVKIFISMIAVISIIVGTIGIVNTMSTAVLERRKDIGIMKAIGAKNKHIFTLFLIESGLLGLAGGILGVAVGVAVGYFGTIGIGNYIGSTLKPQIDIFWVITPIIGSFILGGLAGIVPAMQAARQHPVEALRG